MKKIFAFVLGLYSASAFAADDSGILSLFEGTPAAKMTNQIPLAVKKQRLQKIIDLQLEITTEELKKRVGKTVMVLCQSVSKDNKDELLGKTEQDERIVFKAEKSFIGKFVKVQIDSLSGNTFKGHVIN